MVEFDRSIDANIFRSVFQNNQQNRTFPENARKVHFGNLQPCRNHSHLEIVLLSASTKTFQNFHPNRPAFSLISWIPGFFVRHDGLALRVPLLWTIPCKVWPTPRWAGCCLVVALLAKSWLIYEKRKPRSHVQCFVPQRRLLLWPYFQK